MATGVAALPDDALASVFHGLPPRSLAVVRCVCKAWRDIVDGRTLLLPHLLPHSVRGVFLNYVDHDRPHHLARPCASSTIPKVDGMLSFLPNDDHDWWSVMDHCNGLLLCDIEGGSELCVCNPAMSRWTVLPRPRGEDVRYHHYAGAYIAFDPMESPYFHVALVSNVPKAPSPEHRQKKKKKKKEKEQRTLWEEEGGASFCLDRFFTMADGSEAVADEEETEAAQREDGLFPMAKDGGAAIGEEKADGNHEEDFQQLAEHDVAAIGQEKGEANNEEFQQLPSSVDEDLEPDMDPWRLMEWPPTPWTLHMFSSRAGHWEERAFVRQGMPAGTVEKIRLDREEPTFYGPRRRYAVYHNGSLYVHCRGSFVVRFSLSNSEYQIIETPTNIEYAKPYLGKLQKDVCFGIVHNDNRQLQIWMLSESRGQMEWIMKYKVEVGSYAHYVASLPYHNGRQPEGSWIVEEENIDIKESYEWDSDNDDTFTVDHLEGQEYYYQGLDIIGFHPFKEVVFMVQPFGVVAYHLNATKIQYLGNSRPKCYYRNYTNGIYESFVYTPCMIGDLLYGDETSSQSSSDESQWFECSDADN